MAWTSSSSRFSRTQLFLFLCVFLFSGELRRCESGSFKFNIHHRYSDKVKELLDSKGIPEKHSPGYYAAMVHRDRIVRGRRLASNDETPLTFNHGNDTYLIGSLGFLYYAEVSVGTPGSSFLVALDTGSDVFWLPCNCKTCPTFLNTTSGKKINLNHYNPNASTTAVGVPCSSTLCEVGRQCSSPKNICPYQIQYVSANTSSTGFLVEDVLQLATDDSQSKSVNATITLGCGMIQTGIFEESAAPNGLLGLGMEQISVPSFLASQGLTSNSFSMCFGYDGQGRIDFGDTGKLGQRETPINKMLPFQSYNASFTQINIGGKISNQGFTAIFDSGTSFTYINDPIYSLITKQVDAGMTLQRYTAFGTDFPFEFCYQLPPKATTFEYPIVNFTMMGGAQYALLDPFVPIPIDNNGAFAVCLGMVKSTDSFDLIGQNFMTGYRVIFNRDKMVLGWTESDCYDNGSGPPSGSPPSKSPPSGSPPSKSPPSDSPPTDSPPSDSPPTKSPPSDSPPADSPPPPKAPGVRNGSLPLPGGGAGGDATRLNPLTCVFTVILAILALA